MRLKGKVAIVTGGTGGIGRAIVEKFVKEGCKVAFTFSKNKAMAAKIEKTTKGKAKGYRADIGDFKKTKGLVVEIKQKFKRLDVLINNAGVIKDKPFMMMEESDWDYVLDTNLKGAMNASRACIVTFMKQKGGSIINISSVAGITGTPGQTNYSASKAGLIGFTKALAKEIGPYNVRVNSIAPGFIETPMLDGLKDKEKIMGLIPLRRFGRPDEVAELVMFLVGDRSSYITGQTIIMDGGIV